MYVYICLYMCVCACFSQFISLSIHHIGKGFQNVYRTLWVVCFMPHTQVLIRRTCSEEHDAVRFWGSCKVGVVLERHEQKLISPHIFYCRRQIPNLIEINRRVSQMNHADRRIAEAYLHFQIILDETVGDFSVMKKIWAYESKCKCKVKVT
jgi:hypothetical protein